MRTTFQGLTWDVVVWPGRQHRIFLDKLEALGLDIHDLVTKLHPPGQQVLDIDATSYGDRYATIGEPDVHVSIMRDHDLGDCDEQILRSR